MPRILLNWLTVFFCWVSLSSVGVSPAHAKPPFPVIFIHGLISDASAWKEFDPWLGQRGWDFGGCPKLDGGRVSNTNTKDADCPASDSLSHGDFYRMEFTHNQNLTLDKQGEELESIIYKVLNLNPEKTKVILVGHSMGGLAARNYLQFRANREEPNVFKLITVGTPHHGAVLTFLCQAFPGLCEKFPIDPSSAAVLDLRPNSQAIFDLNTNIPPDNVFYTSIIGTGSSVLLLSGQDGDGLVTVDSQNLGGLGVASGLNHDAISIPIRRFMFHCLLFPTLFLKKISHTCEPEDRGVWIELLKNQFNHPVTEPPNITSVLPNTLPAVPLPQTQSLSIYGSGFLPTSTLTFNNGFGEEFTDRIPTFVDFDHLEYDIAVGPDSDEWTVKVVNGTVESNAHPFTVVATSTDTMPPPAPLDLVATPNSWTNNNLFNIDWTNPSDPSGITKVWYKVGAAPSFANDGAVLPLPRFQTFYATTTAQGGQSLHVWLEDGAGNKDHNDRTSVTLYHEATPPTGSVVINGGDANTNSLLVTLNLSASDTTSGMGAGAQMRFSNDNNSWSPQEPYSMTRTHWHLAGYGGTTDPGTKRVFVQFQDVAGNWSAPFSDEITYTPQGTALPPPGPFLLYADLPFCENGETRVRFFREDSTDANTYSLYRDGQFYQDYPLDNALVISHSLDGQTHNFYVEAANSTGVTRSNTVTVTVPADICPPLATVTTEQATDIEQQSIRMHGTINPNGSATVGWFEYGTDTSYGTSTPEVSFVPDNTDQPLARTIAGLTCGTPYHYRAAARNNAGTVYGNDVAIRTVACPTQPTTEPFPLTITPFCPDGTFPALRISWDDQGAAQYFVYLNGSLMTGTLGLSVELYKAQVGTSYSLQTKAVFSNNTELWSETLSYTLTGDPCTAPQLPAKSPPQFDPDKDAYLFVMDFTDGVPDDVITKIGGDVTEINGKLRVHTATQYDTGSIETQPFPYDPTLPLVVRKVISVDPGGKNTKMPCSWTPNKYGGDKSFGTIHLTAPNGCVPAGVTFFANGDYSSFACGPTLHADIPWNSEYEQIFMYDPVTGEAEIFVDGVLSAIANLPVLPEDVVALSLYCHTNIHPGPAFSVTEWEAWMVDGQSATLPSPGGTEDGYVSVYTNALTPDWDNPPTFMDVLVWEESVLPGTSYDGTAAFHFAPGGPESSFTLHATDGIRTLGEGSVKFALSSGGGSYFIQLLGADGAPLSGFVDLIDYVADGSFNKTKWRDVEIPLVDLGALDTVVKGFTFRIVDNQKNAVYGDKVRIAGEAVAPAEPLPDQDPGSTEAPPNPDPNPPDEPLEDQDDGSTESSPPGANGPNTPSADDDNKDDPVLSKPDSPDPPPTDPGRDERDVPGTPVDDGGPSEPPTNPGRAPGDAPSTPVDGPSPGEPSDDHGRYDPEPEPSLSPEDQDPGSTEAPPNPDPNPPDEPLEDQDDGSTEPSPLGDSGPNTPAADDDNEDAPMISKPDTSDPSPTDPGRDEGDVPGTPVDDGGLSDPPTDPGRDEEEMPAESPVGGKSPGEPLDDQQGR